MSDASVVAPPADSAGEDFVVELPSLGADMDVGTLLEWYVAPGDRVVRGDAIALVSTDKADVDVEIWQSGTVEELLTETGVELVVGTPILRLEVSRSRPTTPQAPPPAHRTEVPQPTAQPDRSRPATHGKGSDDHRTVVPASPYARVAAAEAGIDLAVVVGSGPGGAVLARDVERHRADQAEPAVPVVRPTERGTTDRAASMRRAIATKMAVANRDIPHYYIEHDVDLAPALAWLETRNATRPITDRVLPAALLLSAVAAATAATPQLNGYWMDDRFEPATAVDLAVVVSLRAGGLVTPKIASADQLSIDETMAALNEIVTAARSGALRSSWLAEAGLTVSSLGDRGADRLSGVVFPPQVALVGAGGIRDRPWVVDGAVVARPILTLSLAADHRASDGIIGSRFLTSIAERLEKPEEQWLD
ncbi:MAG: dihydrolipoamide acetyltransferase family protein [Acidimicrobiales bacterium]